MISRIFKLRHHNSTWATRLNRLPPTCPPPMAVHICYLINNNRCITRWSVVVVVASAAVQVVTPHNSQVLEEIKGQCRRPIKLQLAQILFNIRNSTPAGVEFANYYYYCWAIAEAHREFQPSPLLTSQDYYSLGKNQLFLFLHTYSVPPTTTTTNTPLLDS